MATITTSQAPDAKPVYSSLILETTAKELMNVPNYEVPELVFGGSTTVEPGVGEVISPLLLCNTTANTVTVDVEIYRNVENQFFHIVKNLPVPAYDTVPLPLNGQFLKTGDILQASASVSFAIHSTLSFTLGQSEEDDVV
ncbi:hypothetical protein N9987_00720 [bacterium]|jgi:hypothetical protein|nr:hypothetical protein [bacterium]